jgi:hypothetical protein
MIGIGKSKAILAAACLLATALASACSVLPFGHHAAKRSFAQTPQPPAPDYDRPQAWLAFPGRNGLERSTTPGVIPVNESAAPADVFFIHPTTYLKNDVYNARLDAPTTFGDAVLLNQASVFNGCCRIFAPHYRQAVLSALNGTPGAVDLAYGDVAQAFRWYISHENKDRPFIIASHSQGSMLAVRLLQQEILGTPLQKRLVAAYVVGAYVPQDFRALGLPICDAPDQTGCVMSWNTSQTGRTGAFKLTRNATYWWQGAFKNSNNPPAVCVNPLTWTEAGNAAASANLGSLALPKLQGHDGELKAITLPKPEPALTGAVCKDSLLDVNIPLWKTAYQNALVWVYGSYHVADYGLFYDNIRLNAMTRVQAWRRRQS